MVQDAERDEKEGIHFMKFTIGYRTVKTAIGAGLAIALAEWLGLDFYTSAGILTILCIKITKKRSIISSWERFAACILGIGFASAIFSLIGYHPYALTILLILFIPTLVSLNLKEGIITSSVIILHLYTLQKITWEIVLNEFSIIVIGIGMGLIMNLYMPSVEKILLNMQKELEKRYKVIFHEFHLYLAHDKHEWDGKEITECADLISNAKSIAFRDIENHFLRYENQYYHYFKMREKQFEIIQRMLPILSSIDKTYVQCEKLGSFFERLSAAVHPGNTAVLFLDDLENMRQEFREMHLPKDRDEFETRSKLYQLLQDIEDYLIIKSKFKK
ncbi:MULTISPECIES: aromatic acid exporter family protein [unclassified Fictibacillus]|uniref:aromatic acid exporter family protein n=1 Tax=Fictibacillus TaxID=1329200 RepID=UPI001E3B0ADE|nr:MULTISPECIES: aromatic acid exporter family protein [unclassified Fictibacillus]